MVRGPKKSASSIVFDTFGRPIVIKGKGKAKRFRFNAFSFPLLPLTTAGILALNPQLSNLAFGLGPTSLFEVAGSTNAIGFNEFLSTTSGGLSTFGVIDILPNNILVDSRGFTYYRVPGTNSIVLVNVPSLNNIWSGYQDPLIYEGEGGIPNLPVNTGVDTIIVDPDALTESVALPLGYFYDPDSGFFMYKCPTCEDYVAVDAKEVFSAEP